jgi:hypothetical protein
MRHVRELGLAAAVFVLAGCSSAGMQFWDAQDAKPVVTNASGTASELGGTGNGLVVQTIEFRPGVSSATVERLAQRFGCVGKTGAGLITEKGPVEVYRLRCDNGTTFVAQCELRQCRPMR